MCVSKSSLASARMNAPPFSTVAVAARSFVESSAVMNKKKHKSRQSNRRCKYGNRKKRIVPSSPKYSPGTTSFNTSCRVLSELLVPLMRVCL